MASGPGLPTWRQGVPIFHEQLLKSRRILALCGAGLSASSGLPTFRGAGGLWRTHVSTQLATPGAFRRNPGLVWQFYSYRRHMALSVEPNRAHYALAELSRRMPGFLTLTQNVDGLSQRVNHPPDQLLLLHGTLFEVKCFDESCGYRETNFIDPIVPSLAIPTQGGDFTSIASQEAAQYSHQHDASRAFQGGRETELDISDAKIEIPHLDPDKLPQCPRCKSNLLRPGVVWFGEGLPPDVLRKADSFINAREKIDMILVIGTSAQVYPAAGYIEEARDKGASVCVINMDPDDAPVDDWREGDSFFVGDAAEIVPVLLKPIIGDLPDV